MKNNVLTRRIEDVVTPTLTHMGYALVRLQMIGSGKYQTLQVMAERNDNAAMKVEDCEAISRQLSALLDVEDIISSKYQLEVSSPGIDRPLTRLADWDRFKGFLANVELHTPHETGIGNGRKKFQGYVNGSNGDTVALINAENKDENWVFDFDAIAKAKLVLTEELIKAGVSS